MCGISCVLLTLSAFVGETTCFWDVGTTTASVIDPDSVPRQSFFRWEEAESETGFVSWFKWRPSEHWADTNRKRRLHHTAGLSIDWLPIGTGVLLNRRTVLTAANFLEPYMTRQKDLRIWALGRHGAHNTPYRYRVWRVRRLLPKSDNPEHWHGPTGEHVPRHDIAVIHSFDQMYIVGYTGRYLYATRAKLTGKHDKLSGNNAALWTAGSGFMDRRHIRENYRIKRAEFTNSDVVDCSKYLPKWWGKFICVSNTIHLAGVQNGGGLYYTKEYEYATIVGIGCFEIRYNEERVLVFTDLRYYVDWITTYANITPGEYYEYAYPKWFIGVGGVRDDNANKPYIPSWSINYDIFPLG